MSGWLADAVDQQLEENTPTSITITLIGDPESGKTSIKRRMIGKEFDSDELMTVGADYAFRSIQIDEKSVKLKICDIAGQNAYATHRSYFMKRSDAALMIFDLTNEDSFSNIMLWLKEYLKSNKNAKTNLPILIIGNKSDLEDERKVKLSEIKAFLSLAEKRSTISRHIIGFMETSAKTGVNIDDSIKMLTNAVKMVQ